MASRILAAIKSRAQVILSLGLILGVVDQISGDKALIEYKNSTGGIMYTTVSMSQSACVPSEGQSVYFYRDYKIVTCLDQNR